MHTLGVRITRERSVTGLGKREFDRAVKAALRSAALLWIEQFLPLHFEPRAAARYGYAARGRRYNAIKRRARKIRKRGPGDIPEGTLVPAKQPPRAWWWTGDAARSLLEREPASFRIHAVARDRQTVRVPLQIPHPTWRPGVVGDELGRLTNDELEAMHARGIEQLAVELAARAARKRSVDRIAA